MKNHRRNNQISQTTKLFDLIPENQSIVYTNQSIVFIITLEKHRSNSFKNSEG